MAAATLFPNYLRTDTVRHHRFLVFGFPEFLLVSVHFSGCVYSFSVYSVTGWQELSQIFVSSRKGFPAHLLVFPTILQTLSFQVEAVSSTRGCGEVSRFCPWTQTLSLRLGFCFASRQNSFWQLFLFNIQNTSGTWKSLTQAGDLRADTLV